MLRLIFLQEEHKMDSQNETAQRAVTAGQAVVFYDVDDMIFGNEGYVSER